MSLAQALSTYITLNIFIVLSYSILRLGKYIWDAKTELKLHYSILSALIILTLCHPLFPKSQFFSPPAKVWSAQSIKSFPNEYTVSDQGGYLALPSVAGKSHSVSTDKVSLMLLWLSLLVLILGALRIGKDLRSLNNIRSRSYLIRKIKNVFIYVSEDIIVPFSYWIPGSANVVIPNTLISKPLDLKIALLHELQHHRQKDTKWVFVMWSLRIVCVLNPIIHIWSRWLSEIQEFACDETLVDQEKVTSHAYARCLVEVAQTAIHQKHIPACATGLTFLTDRNVLNRRIEKMFKASKVNKRRGLGFLIGVLAVALMGAVAFASQGLVQDRRVTLKEAQEMVSRSHSEFPVTVNDLVLKQLNRYIGTPEGREFMKNALQRLENYKNGIEVQLRAYKVPTAILALPIIESGYQNLSEKEGQSPMKAAGIWQFIPQTARIYGLRVDEKVDERLNTELLTNAAMRYLSANNLQFKDWRLSVMAYNMGEDAVQKAITLTGSRDPWTLIRNGHEGDKDYLSKLMAAILIMENPESVE